MIFRTESRFYFSPPDSLMTVMSSTVRTAARISRVLYWEGEKTAHRIDRSDLWLVDWGRSLSCSKTRLRSPSCRLEKLEQNPERLQSNEASFSISAKSRARSKKVTHLSIVKLLLPILSWLDFELPVSPWPGWSRFRSMLSLEFRISRKFAFEESQL